jgi:hypothetical protein
MKQTEAQRIAQRKYYEKNKLRLNELHRQYYYANKESLLRTKKIYYEANRDELIAGMRKYYYDNKKIKVSHDPITINFS